MDLLREQYELVSKRRSALLDYCQTINPHHFVQDVPAFGNKSMAGLLFHIVDLYWYWIGGFAAIAERSSPETNKNASALRIEFTKVDILMANFFDQHDAKDLISGKVPAKDRHLEFSALELVTHVITHEFHHKGQVLVISRLLGYTPADTDVIRF